jgi:hypothetical protein
MNNLLQVQSLLNAIAYVFLRFALKSIRLFSINIQLSTIAKYFIE